MLVKPLIKSIRAWRRDAAARRELARLSERELADIGLARSPHPSPLSGMEWHAYVRRRC